MKIQFIYLFLLLLCSISAKAQIQMDVKALTIYNTLKNCDNMSNVQIYREGDRDTPFIEAELYIKNVSDSIVEINPDDARVYIEYDYNGKSRREAMMFYQMNDNKYQTKISLKPDKNISLSVYGYMIESGDLMELEFKRMEDRRIALFEILPTLKFEYVEENKIKKKHENVLQFIDLKYAIMSLDENIK